MDKRAFPCSNCGAPTSYKPGSRSLVCGHCGSETHIAEQPASSKRSETEHALHAIPSVSAAGPRTYDCRTCGAGLELPAEQAATQCPFCTSPLVAATRSSGSLPDALLPFAIDRTHMRDAITHWTKGIWFAPTGFARDMQRHGPATPVYLPFWTVDAEVTCTYSGDRGTGTSNGKSAAETRWTRVSGTLNDAIDDFVVPAQDRVHAALMGRLTPWDTTVLEPYRPEFLAGFAAETSGEPPDTAVKRARSALKTDMEARVKRAIGGDRQKVRSIEIELDQVRLRRVLLPVWVSAYAYRGKVYQVAVNGRSGRIAAERPWSWTKIGLTCAALLFVAAALAGAIGLLEALT